MRPFFELRLDARAPPAILGANLFRLEHKTLRLDDIEEEFPDEVRRAGPSHFQARSETKQKKIIPPFQCIRVGKKVFFKGEAIPGHSWEQQIRYLTIKKRFIISAFPLEASNNGLLLTNKDLFLPQRRFQGRSTLGWPWPGLATRREPPLNPPRLLSKFRLTSEPSARRETNLFEDESTSFGRGIEWRDVCCSRLREGRHL